MKHKHLKDFTLYEFDEYQELLKEEVQDTYSILKLFGYDTDDMTVSEMKQSETLISNMTLPTVGVKTSYTINGQKFKTHLNMSTITASQFIDLQNYLKEMKLNKILSVFLVPMKKNWLGIYKSQKYNTGYDIIETQNFLLNNFKINDANELSVFFLNQSEKLLKVIQDYLVKKEMKMRYKLIKTKEGLI